MKLCYGVDAVGDWDGDEAVAFDGFDDAFADAFVVFDDEDSFCGGVHELKVRMNAVPCL